MLRKVAAALRTGSSRGKAHWLEQLDLRNTTDHRIKVFRYGPMFTTWEVVHESPGRLRVQHGAIRGRRQLPGPIEHELDTVLGITAFRFHSSTGSLLVYFDKETIGKLQLLKVLEGAIALSESGLPGGQDLSYWDAQFTLASVTLAASIAAQFAYPALLPATAVLLVVSNLESFKVVLSQLFRLEPGLPTLYSVAVLGALGTGDLFASALMTWLLAFWLRFYQRKVAETRRRLLSRFTQRPRFAWQYRDGIQVATPIADLRPGNVIVVPTGDIIPVDGTILSDTAAVDERLVQGLDSISRKQRGDRVYANSRVLEGSPNIQVTRCGPGTMTSAIGKVLRSATDHTHSIEHATRTANRMVFPTLATAGLGLMVGGLTTAGAVLRPDIVTGARMAGHMGILEHLAVCAHEGIVICDAAILERFAQVDTMLFDHHPALEQPRLEVAEVVSCSASTVEEVLRYAGSATRLFGDVHHRALEAACRARHISVPDSQPTREGCTVTLLQDGKRIGVATPDPVQAGSLPSGWQDFLSHPDTRLREPLVVSVDGKPAGAIRFGHAPELEAAEVIRQLRVRHSLRVGLLAETTGPEVATLAASLGMDFYEAGLCPAAKAEYVRTCQEGKKVAFVGDCRINARVAGEAHVAISLGGLELENNPAQIYLLQPQLTKINFLYENSQAFMRERRARYGYVIASNLLCFGGAFFLNFAALHSVVISNLGTLSVYSKGINALRRLEQKASSAESGNGLEPG
jgi:Cu2+-exporting ATPase